PNPLHAEYASLLERLDDPARWFNSRRASTAELERELLALALQTPWERQRAVRFLHALTRSRLKEIQTPYWRLPLQARLENSNAVSADEACLTTFVPEGKNASFAPGQWQRLLADSRILLRLFAFWPRPKPANVASALCRVRAARLKLALALYQAREGKPATSLEDLVPRYLEELPLDPFSGGPFQYRISAGQPIEWRHDGAADPAQSTVIPAGQGI